MVQVLLLNPPGAMRSCLAGWQDIFALANRGLARGGLPPQFHCRIVAVSPRSLDTVAAPDLALVPVMLGDHDPGKFNPTLLRKLGEWHARGVTLASACAGSFALAAAGLLDGKSATTHWSMADEFRAAFPRVALDIGEMLIEHPAGPGGRPGAIVCGGGITAYIDVALALVARSAGSALAGALARTLLWDPHRPRQALYANAPAPRLHGDEAILRAEVWIETRLADAVRLEDWAAAAGLETRTFERRFRSAHQLAPGQWLRRRRLLLARELLQTSARSWEEIAADCAYNDPGSLRQLFVKEFGLSPRECRLRSGIAGGERA